MKIVLENKHSNIYNNSKDAVVNAVILDTTIINTIDNLL